MADAVSQRSVAEPSDAAGGAARRERPAAGATAPRPTVGGSAAAGGGPRGAPGRGGDGAATICGVIAGVGALPKCTGVGLDAATAGVNSSAAAPSDITVMTPPHTEQRARTEPPTTFAGSTRNTDPHSGQLTFIDRAPRRRRAQSAVPC